LVCRKLHVSPKLQKKLFPSLRKEKKKKSADDVLSTQDSEGSGSTTAIESLPRERSWFSTLLRSPSKASPLGLSM
jgi:hypothetical protein